MLRKHGKVVNVEKRPCPECRKTNEAHGDSDRDIVGEGEQHQGTRNIPERGNQTFLDVAGQGLSSAHRLNGVGVNEARDALGITHVCQIRRTNK